MFSFWKFDNKFYGLSCRLNSTIKLMCVIDHSRLHILSLKNFPRNDKWKRLWYFSDCTGLNFKYISMPVHFNSNITNENYFRNMYHIYLFIEDCKYVWCLNEIGKKERKKRKTLSKWYFLLTNDFWVVFRF